MQSDSLSRRVDEMRARLAAPHDDPADLHDTLQGTIEDLERAGRHVPADLRDAAEDLQAEAVEEFYDNLPV